MDPELPGKKGKINCYVNPIIETNLITTADIFELNVFNLKWMIFSMISLFFFL